MRLKFLAPMSLFAVALAAGGSSPALAQPRPPPHDDHRDLRRDQHDDHRGPSDVRHDPRDDHRGPDADRGPDSEMREHFLQREERERERRNEARRDAIAWEAGRHQRALDHRKDITVTWGVLTNNAEARAELALHADRMSRLNRVIDLAEDRKEPVVVARAKVLVAREIARNSRVMFAIRAKVGAR